MTALQRKAQLTKYLYRLLYVIGFFFIIAISSSEAPFAAALSITLILIFMIPVLVIFFFQICYWGYAWLKFGSIHHEETRPYVYETVVRKEVKQRSWCPLCKENTGCRIRRNPHTGITVHVINGGGRPRKM